MSTLSNVIAETGLDISDPKLIENALAPRLHDRITTVFPVAEVGSVIKNIMTAYKGMAASTTVLGAVGIAIAAAGAAANFLEGRLDKSASDNRKRWEKQKNRTIEQWVRPGDWSSVVYAAGPPPSKLDIKNSVGGWSESEFLAQYNPGIVWMCHRPARADVLLPTWPTDIFTDGYGMMPKDVLADVGCFYPQWSPITGFTFTNRYHRLQQNGVAPIPSKYYDNYSGHLPSASRAEIEAAYDEGPKGLQKLLAAIDAGGYWQAGMAPPPDFAYLFSVGTYPYRSWTTSDGTGYQYGMNASMAALAAGIHSLTPLHALIRESEVARCYEQWLRCTRIRQLPRLPKGQVSDGVYLDDQDLPWAPNPYAGIMCITPRDPAAVAAYLSTQSPASRDYILKKAAEQRKYCALHPELMNVPNGTCFPEGYQASGIIVPWMVARDVELSFRSFFRIRRAALHQMSLTTNSFRDAALKSPDPVMAAAAAGKPPAYAPWHPHDPTNSGWLKPASNGGGAQHAGQTGFGFKGPEPTGPVVNPDIGFGGSGMRGTTEPDDGGGLLLAGAAAAAAAAWMLTRKSKR